MHTFLALGPSQGPPRVHECKVSTQCAWLREGGNAGHARIWPNRIWPKPHWPELVLLVFWPCVCVLCVVLCVVCVCCAAGLAHDSLRTPNVHISAPELQTPPKFHEKTPQREEERMKFPVGERKKSTKFWAPNPSGPTLSGPHHRPAHHPTHPPPPNKNSPNVVWPNSVKQNWPHSANKVGQMRPVEFGSKSSVVRTWFSGSFLDHTCPHHFRLLRVTENQQFCS